MRSSAPSKWATDCTDQQGDETTRPQPSIPARMTCEAQLRPRTMNGIEPPAFFH